MKIANSAVPKNQSRAGKTAKTAQASQKNKSKPYSKPVRKVKPVTGLCVVERNSPKLLVLNLVPNNYLKEIILSPGEEIHRVSIKSVGIITRNTLQAKEENK